MLKRKICAMSIGILVAAMLVVLCAVAYKKQAKADNVSFSLELNTQSENLPEGFFENQQEANAIIENLYEYLRQTYGATHDDSIYTVSGIRAEYFPPYYAGCYINVDGRLILQVVDSYYSSDYKNSDWYQEFVGIVGSENFYCHPVKYSYTELVNAISDVTLGSLSEKFKASGFMIIDAGVDDYKNLVEVHFGSQTAYDVAINDLQSGIYSVSVVDNVPQEDVGLYPGEGVTKSSTGGATFSVACRVRRSEPGGGYTYGFLTCAHAFSGNSNVYLNTGSGTNTLLGICYSFNQHFSGNADVAFIQISSGVTSYNTVYANTTTLNSSYPTTYGIGTVVYKKGDGMSTVESGAVQCNNYSVTFNNVTITDLVKAGYYRAGGDSGGIVFTAPSGGYASPAGIHMGGLTTTSEHYGFFTKMYNALAALQSGPLTYSLY